MKKVYFQKIKKFFKNKLAVFKLNFNKKYIIKKLIYIIPISIIIIISSYMFKIVKLNGGNIKSVFLFFLFFVLVFYKPKRKLEDGIEYGSAKFGRKKDIEAYISPNFEENIIFSETERMIIKSPKNVKYARNKNVLLIGGSGSGKTRFFVKH